MLAPYLWVYIYIFFFFFDGNNMGGLFFISQSPELSRASGDFWCPRSSPKQGWSLHYLAISVLQAEVCARLGQGLLMLASALHSGSGSGWEMLAPEHQVL